MISELIIQERKNSPKVILDPAANKFHISGRSFPENAKKFYEPIIDWFDELGKDGVTINVEFEMYYVSSSSIITILELIKKLDEMNSSNCTVGITWLYDDEDDDIIKIGEDYSKIAKLPITLVKVEEQ